MSTIDAKIYFPKDIWETLLKKSDSFEKEYGWIFCEQKNRNIFPFYASFKPEYNVDTLRTMFGIDYISKICEISRILLKDSEAEAMMVIVDPKNAQDRLNAETKQIFDELPADRKVGSQLRNNIYVLRYGNIRVYRGHQKNGNEYISEQLRKNEYFFVTEKRCTDKEKELGKGLEDELEIIYRLVKNPKDSINQKSFFLNRPKQATKAL